MLGIDNEKLIRKATNKMQLYRLIYYFYEFELRVSVHRGLMNKFQQDAANRVYFSSSFCSTCFGRYIHPSSGASTVQAGMV
jgi:hypothetical protein